MPANTVNYQESGVDISEKYIGIDDAWRIDPSYFNKDGSDILGYGGLWTWGYNTTGSLGSGVVTHRSSPVQVGSTTNWKKISSGGGGSAYAIKIDGSLWAWGDNTQFSLGTGNAIHRSSPVQIGSITQWKSVTPGGDFTYFLRNNQTLWACGYNLYGQIGNGVSSFSVRISSPIQVGALTDWSFLAAGGGSGYAIKTDGTLWTWGANNIGQLGQGDTVHRSSPTQVGALTDWSWVAGENNSSAGIRNDGTLWTWGGNTFGQLGQGDFVHRSSPTQVGSLTDWYSVSSMSVGYGFTKTDGTLWTIGVNNYGQIGDGTVILKSSPVKIGALTNWRPLAPSLDARTAGIKTDGTLWTWGINTDGSLGDGTVIHKSSPIQVGSLSTWKNVGILGAAIGAIK
jgi:alpha-tubulin suppressor-like RCC1 family protein